MKCCQLLGILICSNLVISTAQPGEPSSISIVLDADFSRTHLVELNSQRVQRSKLLDALTNAYRKPTDPVIVLMSEESRFSDWEEMIAILSKVGFSNVRYFLFSKQTMKMTELELSHTPQEFTQSSSTGGQIKKFSRLASS